MLAFLALAGLAALVGVMLVVGFFVLCAKLLFGLVLLPIRLAAAGLKLLLTVVFLLVGLPLLLVGAPLLALLFAFAVVCAPLVLIVWAVGSLARPSPRPAGA